MITYQLKGTIEVSYWINIFKTKNSPGYFTTDSVYNTEGEADRAYEKHFAAYERLHGCAQRIGSRFNVE